MKIAILLFSCVAAVSAQPGPVIQTETREVLLDAIVTAKNGAYIGDLSAKDFRVWQDGKEQSIRGFSVESPSSSSQTRSLVLFFDETSIEPRDQVALRQAASDFIDAEAGPNHRMALIAFNGSMRIAQNFTDNAGRLKDALHQAGFQGLAASPADSDNSHDPSRVEEARAVGRSGAGMVNTFVTRGMIAALTGLGRSLGVLPGRKIVIVFAGALPSFNNSQSELRNAVEEANKSGVAFYAVDVRPVFTQSDPGVYQDTPDSRSSNLRGPFGGGTGARGDPGVDDSPVAVSGASGQQILFDLAGGTGGFVVHNTSDLRDGLQRVGQEQDHYYVLTFVPPESNEGDCHTLKVKVDRKQTTLRSRSSYCTEKPLDLLAGTVAGKDLEQRAAAAQPGDIGASIELPYFYVAPNIARVDVAMEIQADKLQFEKDRKSAKLHAELNFLGEASGADGQVHARFSDALKLDFDNPSQVENLKGKWVHYEKEFKIAPGDYTFTVAFSPSGNGASFGKVQMPLAIEPLTGDLALSALALSRDAHPADDLGLVPALEGRTPLVAGGAQFVPSGMWRFAKTERAFAYFEIYGSEAAAARLHLRILDTRTGEQKWESAIRGGTTGHAPIPVAGSLPIDSLAPGSYRLEITASDPAGKQVKRTADFEVN
jgi:VWFA-related protein